MLTLSVTLPSLTLLSYQASRMCPGAATALAAIGIFAVGLQLVLAATMGRGLPPGKMAALVVVPWVALKGGFWGLRTDHR